MDSYPVTVMSLIRTIMLVKLSILTNLVEHEDYAYDPDPTDTTYYYCCRNARNLGINAPFLTNDFIDGGFFS